MKYFSKTILFLLLCCTFYAYSQENQFPIHIKVPSGDYCIGTTKIILVDSSRYDRTSGRKKPRTIAVKIWYPIEHYHELKYDNYLIDYPAQVIAAIFSSNGLDEKLINQFKTLQSYSSSSFVHESYTEKFPVLIFNPGFYFGIADFYTSMIENLVSNGYIVCCVNHPYEQPYVELTDGHALLRKKRAQLAYIQLVKANFFQFRNRKTDKNVVKVTKYYLKRLSLFDKAVRRWALDTDFFVNHLIEMNKKSIDNVYASMDVEKIGAFGQSLGGSTSGQLSVINKSIKAGINMDCFQFGDVIDKKLDIPFMLMQSEHYYDWNLGNTVIYRNSRADFYSLTFKNAKHFIFSDAALINNIDEKQKRQLIGDIDGSKAMDYINKYTLDFFNHYLLNMPSDLFSTSINDDFIKFDIHLYNE